MKSDGCRPTGMLRRRDLQESGGRRLGEARSPHAPRPAVGLPSPISPQPRGATLLALAPPGRMNFLNPSFLFFWEKLITRRKQYLKLFM